jgi:hypothetical protein
MNCTKTIILLLIGLTIMSIYPVHAADSPESWESWNKLFTNTEAWKQTADKDGIKCYKRPVETLSGDSFRGIVELDTDLSTLIGILMDIEGFTKLIILCSHMEITERVDETSQYLYSYHEIAWPVRTRDSSFLAKWFYDSKTESVWLKIMNKPDYVPYNKKYIRVPIFAGYFKFSPKPDGKVEVHFEGIYNAGGWIPQWVLNYYVPYVPYGTLKKLRKLTSKEKYQGFRFNYKEKFATLKIYDNHEFTSEN